MNETDLIRQIKQLKQIKPRKDWVLSVKTRILGEEKPKFELFPFFRPAYAGLFLALILVALFEFSQSALPGDPLYLLKKSVEKSRAVFVSEEQKTQFGMELANKRLAELNKIAENNETKKLSSAITEFQANVSEVAKNLANAKIDENFVEQTKNLEDNKEKVETVLGTKIDTQEYDNALAGLVESQIKDLEGRSLTEEQATTLDAIKSDFEAKNYAEALIKILSLSQVIHN